MPELIEYLKCVKQIYIDADGVLWDTEAHLFDEYHAKKSAGVSIDKEEYLANYDWYHKIYEAGFIPGSIEFLKEHPEIFVATKSITLNNEGTAKVKILRELGCKNGVFIIPHALKKSDIVDSVNSILVDDTVHNLDDWKNAGGIPLYFNHRNNLVDPWQNTNTNYPMINNLKALEKYLHR